jgi:flagellar biosynthesis protein FlhF
MESTTIRTFKAESMQAALDVVRREMGSDAVILHTRELPKSRWWWKKTTEKVEITAGTGVNIRTPKVIVAAPRVAAKKPAPAPTTSVSREPTLRETLARNAGVAANEERSPRSGASRPQIPATAIGSAGLSLETPDDLPEELFSRPQQEERHSATTTDDIYTGRPTLRAQTRTGVASPRPFTETRPVNHAVYTSMPDAVQKERAATDRVAANDRVSPREAQLQEQLDAIRKMVETLGRSALTARGDVPADLFQLYARLIDGEVDDEVARELICRLKERASPETLADPAASIRQLEQYVETDIRCAGPIRVTPGRQRVVALVGPTGVGKTTTIAKLAANFRLREGVKIGLITVDTYRIAAVEQLRTYAEIIDLPMQVVTGPSEMERALEALREQDLVLIDTAGRSPRDELRIQELKNLLAEARVDETHLVLSLTASLRSLVANVAKFAEASVNSLILTKLDEAVGMGSLVSVARKIPLPISYVTTGQDVPDDIEIARANRLARLVLGEDRLNLGRRSAA